MNESLITKTDQYRCCFCGISLRKDTQHIADPVGPVDGAFCCSYCDEHIVIPARIAIDQIIQNALPQKGTR